jgi:hypothetical protein
MITSVVLDCRGCSHTAFFLFGDASVEPVVVKSGVLSPAEIDYVFNHVDDLLVSHMTLREAVTFLVYGAQLGRGRGDSRFSCDREVV